IKFYKNRNLKSCKVQKTPKKCDLCNRFGGAFIQIQSETPRFVHIACAIWIPEIEFDQNLAIAKNVEKTNFRRVFPCRYCIRTGGASIQCSSKCSTMFHPICGLFQGFFMKVIKIERKNVLLAFCKKHSCVVRKSDNKKLLKLSKLRSFEDEEKVRINFEKKIGYLKSDKIVIFDNLDKCLKRNHK
ncbi:Bromodomain and PHD finger-containing protein 3, partial [Bonamia ostreae]